MKKYFAIIALASLTLVACEKVQEFFDDSNDVTTIYAIAGADRTKTSVDGLNVYWSTGDVVAVANEDGDMVDFTLKSGAGEVEASFEGTLGGKELGDYAVYPFTANSAVEGNSVTVDYLTTWAYGETVLPMWGKKVTEYSFYNVGGAVLVTYSNVPATTNGKHFVFTSNKNITGTVTVSNLGGTPAVSTPAGGNTVTITGIPSDATSVSVIVPVPAGTDYNITAALYEDSTDALVPGTRKAANDRTFTRNIITKFNDVDLTPVITVSSANPMYIAEAGGSQTINYAIANVDASEKLSSATPNVGWITNVNIVDGTSVTFDVETQSHGDNARYGIITLTYPNANPVSFYVSQEGKVYTLSGTTNNATQSGITWAGDFTVGTDWQATVPGTKTASGGQDKAIYSTVALSNDITKIEVTSGERNQLTINSLTITAHSSSSDASSGSNALSGSTSSGSTAADEVYVLSKTNHQNQWIGDYYRIMYHITSTANNKTGTLHFTSAVFYGYIVNFD